MERTIYDCQQCFEFWIEGDGEKCPSCGSTLIKVSRSNFKAIQPPYSLDVDKLHDACELSDAWEEMQLAMRARNSGVES